MKLPTWYLAVAPFILAAVLVVLTAKADAATGCATRSDFGRVGDGQTPATVSALLNQDGAVLGKGPFLLVKRYRACDGTHRVYVEFQRPVRSAARRSYSELWGY